MNRLYALLYIQRLWELQRIVKQIEDNEMIDLSMFGFDTSLKANVLTSIRSLQVTHTDRMDVTTRTLEKPTDGWYIVAKVSLHGTETYLSRKFETQQEANASRSSLNDLLNMVSFVSKTKAA